MSEVQAKAPDRQRRYNHFAILQRMGILDKLQPADKRDYENSFEDLAGRLVRPLRDVLAALQHEIWSHWMKYMFTQGTDNPDGSFTLPAVKVERWKRQMETDYFDLPESERQSDLDQADKILAILK